MRLRAAAEKQHNVRLESERDALTLARRIVRSPINGVVIKRHKSAGEYVEGDPIVQLAQLDPLRIEVVAPLTLYGQLKKGMQAVVTPELVVDGSFIATVVSIDPVMDAATATFGVRLSLPNPQRRLPAGLKCTLIVMPEAAKTMQPHESDTTPEPTRQAAEEKAPMPQPTPAKAVRKNMAAVAESAPEATRPQAKGKEKTTSPQPLPAKPVRKNPDRKKPARKKKQQRLPKQRPKSTMAPLPQAARPSVNTTAVSVATDRSVSSSEGAACATLGPIKSTATGEKSPGLAVSAQHEHHAT